MSLGFRGCREGEEVQMILSVQFRLKERTEEINTVRECREFCFENRQTLASFLTEDQIKKSLSL